jgi:hypothetical protein
MKKVVATVQMRIGEEKPFGFNLTELCTNYYRPGEIYGLGEVVRPRELKDGGKGPTGLEYTVTVPGQGTGIEPTWPTTAGQTVTTGTLTLQAQAISNSSLTKTISNSVWSDAEDGSVTVDDESSVTSNGEQKTQAFLTAVALAAGSEVVNTITFTDGHIELLALKVKVGANG